MKMALTAIHEDVNPGFIPEKYRPYIDECVEFGQMSNGYRREFQEWTTATPGLTIEFVWHTHDGQSGSYGTVLIVDYKRDGKYL